MKRVLIGLGVVAVLLGIGAFALHQYLHSSHVTAQVVSKLEAALGSKVNVGTVDVGVTGSTVRDVELFDKTGTGEPWLKIGSVHIDLSLLELARGEEMPRHVSVDHPVVLLRFDRDGALLTDVALPESKEPANPDTLIASAPEVAVKNGEVIVRKEGQPDLLIKNVTAKVTSDATGLELHGICNSPGVGNITLTGAVEKAHDIAKAQVKTGGDVKIDQALALRLPFVPATVWEQLTVAHGLAGAELAVSYDLKAHHLDYRLDLTPHDLDVTIPPADVHATKASGRLTVENDIVRLRDFQGNVLGGTVKADGDLAVKGATVQLDFPKIAVSGIDIGRVPPAWGKLPPQFKEEIQGQLDGSAEVHVTISPPNAKREPGTIVLKNGDQVQISGHGQAKIVNAKILGNPAKEAPTLNWHPARGFSTKDDVGGAPTPPQIAPKSDAPAKVTRVAKFGPNDDPPILQYPLRVVDTVVDGLQMLSSKVVDTVDTVARAVAEPPQPKADGSPSYIELNLKLSDVDLAQFAEKLKLKLPFHLAGKLSFQVKASLPIDRPGELKAYKVFGKAQVVDLLIEEAHIARLDADFKFLNGILELEKLQGQLPVPAGTEGGTFTGSARMGLSALDTVTANLELDRVPIAALAEAQAKKLDLTGSVSGKVSAQAPASSLKDPRAWQASGALRSDVLGAAGLKVRDLTAALSLRAGILSLSKLQGKLEGAPFDATAAVRLRDGLPFDAVVTLHDWDVSSLQRLSPQFHLPVPVAGKFTASVDVKGEVEPLKYQAGGSIVGSNLKADKFTVTDVKFRWDTSGDTLVVKNFAAHLYGGAIVGSATLPLKPEVGGAIDLRIDKLDARQLAKDLPVPIRIEGEIEGTVKATIAPAPEGQERTASGSVAIKAPRLRVQNIPTEQLHGTLDYKKGILAYKLEGKTLGGTFELEGQVPGAAPAAKAEPPPGHLRIRNIDLGQLAKMLRPQGTVPLTGTANLDLAFTQTAANAWPDGSGTFRLNDVRWQQQSLLPRFEGRVILKDGVVRLPDVGGTLAGGSLRVRLTYNLRRPAAGSIALTVDSAESAQLLAPWVKAGSVQGPINARIRGTLGSEWSGSADLEMTRGKILGLDVSDLRVPVAWRFAPAEARGQVDIYEGGGQVARGRVQGRLSFAWDVTARAEGQVRFFGVDIQNLLRETTGSAQLGAGQLTGRFDFVGRDMRSVNDLTGNLQAAFNQAQPLQVPVLSQLTPFLGVGSSTTFQKGALLARLDRGILRIQSLSLTGNSIDLFADGTVTLEERLNLEVVARTGQLGLPTGRLRLLGLQIPVFGPLPVSLALEASNLLSNQVIYLRVGGTIRNPTIRPEPVRILTAEAIRFFVTRAVVVPNP